MNSSSTRRRAAIATGVVILAAAGGGSVFAGGAVSPAAATIPLSELEGRIAFVRWGGFNNGFFIADADGTDEQRVVAIPTSGVCCMSVARDGSRAAVPAVSRDLRPTMEVVDLADLTSVVLDPTAGPPTDPGPFSPDGTQMAFTVYDPDGPGFHVYIGPWDDPGSAVQIVPTDAQDHGQVFAVDYSPDGRQLVLYQPAPGDPPNVHGSLAIIDVDGGGFRPLTPEGVDLPCCARWSPDGSRIAFADGEGRLLTISPDGSGLTEVFSTADGWAFQPSWSPDGSALIFSLNSVADPNEPVPNVLDVINVDGSGLTPLITTADHKDGAAWVPDVREAG